MALPAPSRQRMTDQDGLVVREWLNWFDSIVTEATAPAATTPLDATRLVGLVPLETIQNLTDENISPTAAIQWSKVSKVGSSLGDLETRSATDLATGTLDATRLANSGVAAATYGSVTQIPQLTIDAKGRVTAAANLSISAMIAARVSLRV